LRASGFVCEIAERTQNASARTPRCGERAAPAWRSRCDKDSIAETHNTSLDTGGWYYNRFAPVLEPFMEKEECIRPIRAYHRLPLWLIVFPLPNGLVPYLYAATYLLGGFYPQQEWPPRNHSTRPCFVQELGRCLDDDRAYCADIDEDCDTLYITAVRFVEGHFAS